MERKIAMVVLGLLGMTINAQAQTSKSKKAKPMESKQEVIVTAPHHVQVSQEGAGNNIQIQQSERSSDSTTLVTTIIQDGTNRVIMVQDTLPGQKARHQVQIHQSGQGNTAQVSQQGSGNKVVIKQGSN